jgi:transaldolase
LWASTSTKNPAYSDLLYVENLVGPDTVNTLPIETLEAFRNHGKANRTIDKDLNEAKSVLAKLKEVGVDLDGITKQLQKDGVKAFVDSLDQLLRALEKKTKDLAH